MRGVGIIAFWKESTEELGVFKPVLELKSYKFKVIREVRSTQESNNQNGSFNILSTIELYADLYLKNNWPSIAFVEWNGTKWRVKSITPDYPKISISLGGVYNENEGGTSQIVKNGL